MAKYKGKLFYFFYFILCILIITSFFPWYSPLGNKKNTIKISTQPTDIQIMLDQYQTVGQEMRIRIEHEHQLFIYQFIIIGSVLSYILFKENFFKKKPGAISNLQNDNLSVITLAFGVSLIPLFLVDIHIKYNSMIISELGTWTRGYYEQLISNSQYGWENYLVNDSDFHSWRYFPYISSLLCAPTVVIFSFYFHMRYKGRQEMVDPVHQVVHFGVLMSLIFFSVINHFSSRPKILQLNEISIWFLVFLISFLISVVVVFYVTTPKKRE